MKFQAFIGIDVSKETFDVSTNQGTISKKFSNSMKGYNQLRLWLLKESGPLEEALFCMEHTGMYSYGLMEYLDTKKLSFCMVSGLEVKRSLGIQRGKNDKVDAIRLSEYIYLRREKIKPFKLPTKNLLKLKSFLSYRSRLVRQRAGYKASIKEYRRFMPEEAQAIIESQDQNIRDLTVQINRIDKELKQLVKEDKVIANQYELATSVQGVGMQVALTIIAFTNCFTSFETSRQFASYSGTAPFDNTSGTSLKGKTKVSHLANKRIKSILHLAAMSGIVHNAELREYYHRRIAEGKNKMSTLNIVKNKIIGRVFAAVKRGTPYVDVLKFAA